MNIPLRMTRDEQNVLTRILDKHGVNLNNLFQAWVNFVGQVEKGYEDSIYDYTNDLSNRDVFEEILLEVPGTIRNKLDELIQPWDNRFKEATREVKRPLAPGVTREAPSWWFRIPKKLSKELEDDLRSEKILE